MRVRMYCRDRIEQIRAIHPPQTNPVILSCRKNPYDEGEEAHRALQLEQHRRSALGMKPQADPSSDCYWCPGDKDTEADTQR